MSLLLCFCCVSAPFTWCHSCTFVCCHQFLVDFIAICLAENGRLLCRGICVCYACLFLTFFDVQIVVFLPVPTFAKFLQK